MRLFILLALSALIALTGCSKKTSENEEVEPVGTTEGTAESGVALDAARQSVIGQWSAELSPSFLEGLEEAERDLLKSINEVTRTGMKLNEDGTIEMSVVVIGEEKDTVGGTWKIDELGMTGFSLVIHEDEQEEADVAHVEPQADGSLLLNIDGAQMILKKVNLDEYLNPSSLEDVDEKQEQDEAAE